MPTLLVIPAQLKAEAFYLEKCKTTAEAFHFLHVEVPDFPCKNEMIVLRWEIELDWCRDSWDDSAELRRGQGSLKIWICFVRQLCKRLGEATPQKHHVAADDSDGVESWRILKEVQLCP
jgi:hypothetical protein